MADKQTLESIRARILHTSPEARHKVLDYFLAWMLMHATTNSEYQEAAHELLVNAEQEVIKNAEHHPVAEAFAEKYTPGLRDSVRALVRSEIRRMVLPKALYEEGF